MKRKYIAKLEFPEGWRWGVQTNRGSWKILMGWGISTGTGISRGVGGGIQTKKNLHKESMDIMLFSGVTQFVIMSKCEIKLCALCHPSFKPGFDR